MVSWVVATGAGITSSLLGASTSPAFNTRKFGGAVATGAFIGLVFGIANASVNPVFKNPSSSLFDIVYQMGLVFVGALGGDFVRNRVGDLIIGRGTSGGAGAGGAGAVTVPVANAGQNQIVSKGQFVTLDGSGSIATAGGTTIVSYSWVQTGGLGVNLTGANTVKPLFTAPQQSMILSFSLTVTDSRGAVSSPASVTVTVV